jgi:succinoglycan biosynthesis transport protein ExoP
MALPPSSDSPRPLKPVQDTRLAEPRFKASVPAANTPSTLGVDDVLFTLFRHKKKIILFALLGLAAAAAVHLRPKGESYTASAKLYIRYVVMEGKGGPADGTITKSPDRGGETILSNELEILRSLDLATKVAQTIGPAKVLEKLEGGDLLSKASMAISERLNVYAAPWSSVVTIIFKHPDPEITAQVVRIVVEQYLKTHVEIHRSSGMVGEFLAQETDQLRSRLAQTEEELRRARAKAGVLSVEDARRAITEQVNGIRQQIFSLRAEQAGREMTLKQLAERRAKLEPKAQATPDGAPADNPSPAAATAPVAPAPTAAADPAPTPAVSASVEEPAPLTPAIVEEYRLAAMLLETHRQREQQLLLTFTPENSRVQGARAQREAAERNKRDLEARYPDLTQTLQTKSAASPGGVASGPVRILADEYARAMDQEISALNTMEAKVKMLTSQIETLRAEAAALDQTEGTIQQLLRKKELEESNYRRYAASLEQSRINEALGSGKVSNISIIQAPTPAFIDPAKEDSKLVKMLAAGGIGLGLAWAFLVDFFLDRSVRRPADIERGVRAPLFLTIPRQARPKTPKRRKKKDADTIIGESALQVAGTNTRDTVLDESLAPYCETLRDRLIGYFESVNLTHKPKLIGLTGIGKDTGVTTLATGLARTLSETGDGNVLLVDLTPGQGSSQYFHRGSANCGLEDLLATRDDQAQVQDRLYVVSEDARGDKLSRMLPQRFAKLLPQLKSGDFDYIIFDMPPVNQISITPRLAGYMDMMLLVVESERDSRENLQQANELLLKSNAAVGTILNKSKNYLPTFLRHELPA